jgi:hypothetical protein
LLAVVSESSCKKNRFLLLENLCSTFFSSFLVNQFSADIVNCDVIAMVCFVLLLKGEISM